MFREGFIWGAASASFQIEGAADSRGKSIWDIYCRVPGAVFDGHTGDVACDHYNRSREDIDLLQCLGAKAYRFSVAWPRVMPTGIAPVVDADGKGLDFYDRLVDGLLNAGVEPWVTLYHWDFPYDLYLKGGWLHPDSPQWFADYSSAVVRKLSDRVSHWMTLNEPQIFVGLGYADKPVHAPGLNLPWRERLLIGHNALLAHGRAVQTIRAEGKKPAMIGWAPVGKVDVPNTETAADIEIAKSEMFSCRRRDFWSNTWFGDPVCKGHYPEDGLSTFGEDAPKVGPRDMEIINQKIDFYGLNIYSGNVVKAGPEGEPQVVQPPVGGPRNSLRWAVEPRALYWGPKLIAEHYGLPVIITENGMCNLDWVSDDGKVHDPQRIEYTKRYLRELLRAADEGVDIRGYFHWSIMDNFEWAEGYRERFGLIHVDYQTLKRTPKDSYYWYREVIASNGRSLAMTPPPPPPHPAGQNGVLVEPRGKPAAVR